MITLPPFGTKVRMNVAWSPKGRSCGLLSGTLLESFWSDEVRVARGAIVYTVRVEDILSVEVAA